MSKHNRKNIKSEGFNCYWTRHFLKTNAMQHLLSFVMQSRENLAQGAFPPQQIETTQIRKDGRGVIWNFVVVKLGQQKILTLFVWDMNDTGPVTQMSVWILLPVGHFIK